MPLDDIHSRHSQEDIDKSRFLVRFIFRAHEVENRVGQGNSICTNNKSRRVWHSSCLFQGYVTSLGGHWMFRPSSHLTSCEAITATTCLRILYNIVLGDILITILIT